MKKSLLFLFFLILSIFTYAQEKDINKFYEVYPNPAIDHINIKFKDINYIDYQSISIFSLIGNPVDIETESLDYNTIQISLREVNSGIYFLSLKNIITDKREIIKFLKVN
tara:strand:+ start:253 stop:582 length:330 start_codon:yes stop_codon:yes gene_type:complete